MNETLLLTNLIAGMAITPAPYYPPSAILHTLPYTEIVPGPGITLTNGWLTVTPERRTGLPGTPREGEVLTTEEVEMRPCFAAVYPACPGHAHTNLTRWRWTSGAWSRIWETNSVLLGTGLTKATNTTTWVSCACLTCQPKSKGAAGEQFTDSIPLVSGGSVEFESDGTNILFRLPVTREAISVLKRVVDKTWEALKP